MAESEFQRPSSPESEHGADRNHEDWQFSELKDRPEIVLSVLEPDQLVVAKEQTPFGRMRLSRATGILLWALRIYVVVMMAVVIVSIYHAIQAAR